MPFLLLDVDRATRSPGARADVDVTIVYVPAVLALGIAAAPTQADVRRPLAASFTHPAQPAFAPMRLAREKDRVDSAREVPP